MPLHICDATSKLGAPLLFGQPLPIQRPGLSLLPAPTHLEAIVEDPMAPQKPGCPFKGTGRSREVKPLRWAGDDSQDKGRCPLAVQEVYPHLGEKATIPQSWPPGEEATHPAHPCFSHQPGREDDISQDAAPSNAWRDWKLQIQLFPLLFPPWSCCGPCKDLVPRGSLPLANSDIFSVQRQGPLESPPCSHIQDPASSLEYPSSPLMLPSLGTRWALTCNSHHRV